MNVKKLIQSKIKKDNQLDELPKKNELVNVSFDSRLDSFIENLNSLFIDGVINHDINVNGNVLCRSLKTTQLVVRGTFDVKDDAVKVIKKSNGEIEIQTKPEINVNNLKNIDLSYNRVFGTIEQQKIRNRNINIKQLLKPRKIKKDRISKIHRYNTITSNLLKDSFSWIHLKASNKIPEDKFDQNTLLSSELLPTLITSDISGNRDISEIYIEDMMFSPNVNYYNNITSGLDFSNLSGNISSQIINNYDICFNILAKNMGWDQNNEMNSDELFYILSPFDFGKFLGGTLPNMSNIIISDNILKDIIHTENINKFCNDIVDKIDIQKFSMKYRNNKIQIGVIADEIENLFNLTHTKNYEIFIGKTTNIDNYNINIPNIKLEPDIYNEIVMIEIKPIDKIIVFDSNENDIDIVYNKIMSGEIQYEITDDISILCNLKKRGDIYEYEPINKKNIFELNFHYSNQFKHIKKLDTVIISKIYLKDIKHVLFNNLFYITFGSFQFLDKQIDDSLKNNDKIINNLINELEEDEEEYIKQLNEIEKLEKLI